jgi:hypothetical protein
MGTVTAIYECSDAAVHGSVVWLVRTLGRVAGTSLAVGYRGEFIAGHRC